MNLKSFDFGKTKLNKKLLLLCLTTALNNAVYAAHWEMTSTECIKIPKQKPKSIVLQCPMLSVMKKIENESKKDLCERAGCCYNKYNGKELCWTNKIKWDQQKQQKIRIINSNKNNIEASPPQIPVATLQKLKEQSERRQQLAELALKEAQIQEKEEQIIQIEQEEIQQEIQQFEQDIEKELNNDDDDDEHRVYSLVNFGKNTEETLLAIKRQDDSELCLSKIDKLMQLGKTQCLAVVPLNQRSQCDVRSIRHNRPELSLCSACLQAGCCYDPTPRINNGRLTPMCFHASQLYEINQELEDIKTEIEEDLINASTTTEATTTLSPEEEYVNGVMKGHGHATVAPDMFGKKYQPTRDNRYKDWIQQNYNTDSDSNQAEQPMEISELTETQSKMQELIKNNPRLSGKFGMMGININKPSAPSKPSSATNQVSEENGYNDRMKAFMSMYGSGKMPLIPGMSGLTSSRPSSSSNSYMDKIRSQFMGQYGGNSGSSNNSPTVDKMQLLQSFIGGGSGTSSNSDSVTTAQPKIDKEPQFSSHLHAQMYKQLMTSFKMNLQRSGKSPSAMERDMETFKKTILKRFDKYLIKDTVEEKDQNDKEEIENKESDQETKENGSINSETGSIEDFNSQTSNFIPWMDEKYAIGNDEPNNCYPQTCGVPELDSVDYLNTMKKIVGGTTAGSPEFWPWQVSIRRIYANTVNFSHLCGGTLISNKWILTAAHCFIRYTNLYYQDGVMEDRIDQFMIHVGRYHKSEIRGEDGLQMRTLEKYIAHENFSPTAKNQINDIALGKMAHPVIFTEHVRPACLPSADTPPKEGDRMWITGWGDDMNIGPSNDVLKELSLPVASVEMCKNDWKSYYNDGWICSDRAFKEDACTGDSGGPAVHKTQDGRWRIVGITAAGSMKCSTTMASVKAGVFTNVVKFRHWIDANTGGMC